MIDRRSEPALEGRGGREIHTEKKSLDPGDTFKTRGRIILTVCGSLGDPSLRGGANIKAGTYHQFRTYLCILKRLGLVERVRGIFFLERKLPKKLHF